MSKLQCLVVTPDRTVHDAPAEFAAMPLFDGEIGIAPGHTPLVGRLGCGELRVLQAGQTARFYVEGGFVEVLGDVVTVLTPRAVPAESLDPLAAEGALDAARQLPANTPELMAARDRAVAEARARLRVAQRAGIRD